MVIDEAFEFQIEVRGDRANCNEAVMTATIGPRSFCVVLSVFFVLNEIISQVNELCYGYAA